MSDFVRPHKRQPTRLPRPWDSPGKDTGVGCHFLLQCMKVKSESEVAQLCPTLHDPMDCSLPGSSVHGIFQARGLEWGAIAIYMACPEEETLLTWLYTWPSLSFPFDMLLQTDWLSLRRLQLTPAYLTLSYTMEFWIEATWTSSHSGFMFSGAGVSLVAKPCLILYDPPGSSAHGTLQERILEQVAISFSRGSSRPRDWTYVSCIAGGLFTIEPWGKP